MGDCCDEDSRPDISFWFWPCPILEQLDLSNYLSGSKDVDLTLSFLLVNAYCFSTWLLNLDRLINFYLSIFVLPSWTPCLIDISISLGCSSYAGDVDWLLCCKHWANCTFVWLYFFNFICEVWSLNFKVWLSMIPDMLFLRFSYDSCLWYEHCSCWSPKTDGIFSCRESVPLLSNFIVDIFFEHLNKISLCMESRPSFSYLKNASVFFSYSSIFSLLSSFFMSRSRVTYSITFWSWHLKPSFFYLSAARTFALWIWLLIFDLVYFGIITILLFYVWSNIRLELLANPSFVCLKIMFEYTFSGSPVCYLRPAEFSLGCTYFWLLCLNGDFVLPYLFKPSWCSTVFMELRVGTRWWFDSTDKPYMLIETFCL